MTTNNTMTQRENFASTQSSFSGWKAQLNLAFARGNGRTVLAHRQHVGPLRVQRPFYPEQDVCHSYILHPPGGVVGGDELHINIHVQGGAHALVTTPASTKFYRSAGDIAQQHQTVRLEEKAILEYLPQDTILFDACKVATYTRIDLAASAKFAGWEILCQGRPASNESFDTGQCRLVYEIYRQGRPLLIEQIRLHGGCEMQRAQWGIANYPVTASFMISDADETLLELARSIEVDDTILFSASLINGILVCRYLGWQGIEARNCFAKVWAAIRTVWIGREVCRPRIWDT